MQSRPKVTICGSFKRAHKELADLFLELEATGCRVLSPLSLDFKSDSQEYPKLASESDLSILEIEKFHFRAIAESDFIWLHCPSGYVGLSGAFELGYAIANGKKIFASAIPDDPQLSAFISVVPSVFMALRQIT